MERTRQPLFLSVCVTAAVVLMALSALAAPSISNVSGELINGQSVTIFGSEIGVKSPAAPILWDNFESGSTSPGWDQVNDLWEVYSGEGNVLGSSYALRADRSLASSIELLKLYNTDYGDKLYIFAKRRWDFSMLSRNQKFIRYWQSEGSQSVAWAYLWTEGNPKYQSRDSYTVHVDPNNPVPKIDMPIELEAIHNGNMTWKTEETFIRLESAIGACDGVMGYRVDNNIHRSWPENRCMFDADHNFNYRKIYIDNYGECEGGGHDCLTAGSYVWVDDVYIDNTWARVVIGDKPVYDDCTQLEIQPPVSWDKDKGEIVITLNQGSFDTLTGKYVFVVDAGNNPSKSFLLGGDVSAKLGIVQDFQKEVAAQSNP